MVGADSVVKLIATVVFILILLFVMAVGFTLMDPIYNNVIDTGLMTDLGWGAPQNVVMLFAGIGLIGLGLAVVVWWIFGWIREDVRQDVQPRGPF